MDSAALIALATKVKRATRQLDVIELCEGVEAVIGHPPECPECERRRVANAERVARFRKKAKRK